MWLQDKDYYYYYWLIYRLKFDSDAFIFIQSDLLLNHFEISFYQLIEEKKTEKNCS